MAQDQKAQEQAKVDLIKWMGQFVGAMDPEGPFFTGATFGMVDVILAPWLLRQPRILKERRDFEFPKEGKTWQRYHRWFEAVVDRPSVVNTTSDWEGYKVILERYANNTAQSEAAKAIRAGTAIP